MEPIPEELKELNDLRKEKQATLCDKIKESITCIGEDLGKTEHHIQELRDLQDAR